MKTRMRVANIPEEELKERCKNGTMYADFVPIGKWIGSQGIFTCSQCGREADYFIADASLGYYLAAKPNFCPNCGADMRKGDAE